MLCPRCVADNYDTSIFRASCSALLNQISDFSPHRGQRISFAMANARFFGKAVSAVLLFSGFIMAGFTTRKQALHDLMAGTLVVRG